ncbi:MAG TPA: glutathione S-transferase family protein [Thermoanaerobaculia bacterium]|nr:glutathione S-transferase family protein [Thermoanaerobaculia bacterium]
MKLYRFPGSTACRAVELFCAEAGIQYEPEVVDILTGKQYEAPYSAINPTGVVPTLVDGDLVLGESSAILKYLADKVGSPAYPKDLKQRAKVNEMMDWWNSNFYREFGYHFVYAQTLQHIKLDSPQGTSDLVARGQGNATRLVGIVDKNFLGDGRKFLCGNEYTIADSFAASILSIGDWIGQSFSAYPNVDRWLKSMMARPSWKAVDQDHKNMAGFFSSGTYSKIGGTAKAAG